MPLAEKKKPRSLSGARGGIWFKPFVILLMRKRRSIGFYSSFLGSCKFKYQGKNQEVKEIEIWN